VGAKVQQAVGANRESANHVKLRASANELLQRANSASELPTRKGCACQEKQPRIEATRGDGENGGDALQELLESFRTSGLPLDHSGGRVVSRSAPPIPGT